MPHLLIYSSPVDHHNPAEWYRYRDRIRGTLERAGAASAVAVDDDPLFTYGVDAQSVLARVNETQPDANEIVLAEWSTIFSTRRPCSRLPIVLAPTDIGDELVLFVDGADAPRTSPRVTIGRSHMDDALVCLYNHAYVADASLQFVV